MSQQTAKCFIVGPLRTGSSLMSRCLDDHPSAICLCESEINRALFRDYIVAHHFQRMLAHGLTAGETAAYLDRLKQDDVAGLELWYARVRGRLSDLYEKPRATLLGDKSPDFYRSPELVDHLAKGYPLIYTVRDPRAIFASIIVQNDSTDDDKAERWASLIENFQVWEPYLDQPNILVVRYEDFMTTPGMTMSMVYSHLGLPDSSRFMTNFPRLFPARFLWETAIDMSTGRHKGFDPRRMRSWTSRLTEAQLQQIHADPSVRRYMDRLGYS